MLLLRGLPAIENAHEVLQILRMVEHGHAVAEQSGQRQAVASQVVAVQMSVEPRVSNARPESEAEIVQAPAVQRRVLEQARAQILNIELVKVHMCPEPGVQGCESGILQANGS